MVISSTDGMLMFFKRLSTVATMTLESLNDARSSNTSPQTPSLIVSSHHASMSPLLDGLIDFPAATPFRTVPERQPRLPAVVLPPSSEPPRAIPPMSRAEDGVSLVVLCMSRILPSFFPPFSTLIPLKPAVITLLLAHSPSE